MGGMTLGTLNPGSKAYATVAWLVDPSMTNSKTNFQKPNPTLPAC